MTVLLGKTGLLVNIADEHGLAYGCARHFRDAGGKLGILPTPSAPYAPPSAMPLGGRLILPFDVTQPGALEVVFSRIAREFGGIDFTFDSIAYAPKATALLHDTIRVGLDQAGEDGR